MAVIMNIMNDHPYPHLKQKLIHFIQRAAQRLKLHYQPTLHAIQVLNILISKQRITIMQQLRHPAKGKCLAVTILSLCYRLYFDQGVHLREWVGVVREECTWETADIVEYMRESQLKIMGWLRWKLAIPLLYDQVMMIASLWDRFNMDKTNFPLIYSEINNHNALVSTIKICLYNFDSLIEHNSLQSLSLKTRKLSLAVFSIAVKTQLKNKIKDRVYSMSSKISIGYVLGEFLKNCFNVLPEHISLQSTQVADLLQSYQRVKQGSKSKKVSQGKTPYHRSIRQSEDKENGIYYVARTRMASKKQEKKGQKGKSRSRTKKTGKTKNSMTMKGKKSSSTKSILTGGKSVLGKNSSIIKPHKQPNAKQYVSHLKQHISHAKQQKRTGLGVRIAQPVTHSKKTLKYNISKASKRSDKSHIASKTHNATIQEFTTKSTYWTKATPSTKTQKKTQKKSNHSSIRMHLR